MPLHSIIMSQILLQSFHQTRKFSLCLCEDLEPEDFVIQSMPDASPLKWHLAHTSWFFETFLLEVHGPDYKSPFPHYDFLFNSYYNAVGPRHERPKRGLLSRPTVRDTMEYRAFIDNAITELVERADAEKMELLVPLLELGIHHEQQHQELMLSDLKHAFWTNPLRPALRVRVETPKTEVRNGWREFEGGLVEVGATGEAFHFDNEAPRHKKWLEPFAIAQNLVTCGDWMEFIAENGYKRSEFWLAAGWNWVQNEKIEAPLYWETEKNWEIFTLSGTRTLEMDEPVAHISYFEADAFARWSGARLPTESEWEIAAQNCEIGGNFAESGQFHPVAPAKSDEMFGNVWQWTRSQYEPYPRYSPIEGALGEYNGKFMCNQFVLRGGSCATPQSHIRATYRNFFPPETRWQFAGLRLARDC
ncbi:MAG TPA: ergothioneine biosynthesis protein EgtB [Abditibacterium sp.]